ncbi:Uncharacterized protein SCG7086_AA_00480 [Chlamydiales bacterium SCGC AG-110-P3]|nr:Uncharacterized protein SCG7086_AA_00480 [Chlamydiales bacterium SCGC AG-110-P3]
MTKIISLIEKAFALKATAAFQNVDLNTLLSIGDQLDVACYKAGDDIFHQGRSGHNTYIIIEGTVTLSDGDTTVTLESTTLFGEEEALTDTPRRYTATAATLCTVLLLSRTALINSISECPTIAINLLTEYCTLTLRHFPCNKEKVTS